MRIAMLSPIAWRTPPRSYGPWERVVSLLTEGLVSKGIEVTLLPPAIPLPEPAWTMSAHILMRKTRI